MAKRGQAMVEFALVGPLFLLLLFLIAESALYVNALATIDYSTREGARQAAICGSTALPFDQGQVSADQCQSAVSMAVLSHLGILPHPAGSNPAIAYPGPTAAGTPVTVAVKFTYSFYLDLFIGLAPTVDINSQATTVSQQ